MKRESSDSLIIRQMESIGRLTAERDRLRTQVTALKALVVGYSTTYPDDVYADKAAEILTHRE